MFLKICVNKFYYLNFRIGNGNFKVFAIKREELGLIGLKISI